MNIGGIVLCGGRSSRMGQPKAWLPFAGEPMLTRVVRRLGPEVTPVVVVAAPGQSLPELPTGVRVVRDAIPDGGPLPGLLVGLAELLDEAEAVFVTGCDFPLLQVSFVRSLHEHLGDCEAVMPRIDGQLQPLVTIYRVKPTHQAAGLLLDQGQTAIRKLATVLDTRFIERAELESIDPGLNSLRNVNTPAEYAAMQLQFPGVS